MERIAVNDAEKIWKLQVDAFQDLYNKYQDTETNPATEPIEKIIMRLEQPFTYYYYIKADGDVAGAIRVVDTKEDGEPKRISPIFIIRKYRNKGIAQKAINEAEMIHGTSNWELSTILQEEGNCHLYEKLGYYRTGHTEKINDVMTLVFYKKD